MHKGFLTCCISLLSLSLVYPSWRVSHFFVRGHDDDNDGTHNSSSSLIVSPFCIIVDGGSTGSRLHIYEFIIDSLKNETHCVRRGSKRVHIPLSTLHLENNSTMAQHLIPLFEYASLQIPPRYHSSTLVKIQATAGMRLLSESQQTYIYDSLYQGLFQNPSFTFTSFQRLDIATLSGNLEAFYGVVAANYLQGNIDPFLNVKQQKAVVPVVKEEEEHKQRQSSSSSLVGALDMGGSSTQIVYFSPESSSLEENGTCTAVSTHTSLFQNNNNNSCEEEDVKMNPQDFVSISHLSFGVDQFRQRLYDSWIQDPTRFTTKTSTMTFDDKEEENIIYNPCHFNGYTMTYKGYTMIGTGNASTCAMEINRLIPHHPHSDFTSYLQPFVDTTSSSSTSSLSTSFRMVGGVQYPTLQGKFIAMSLFFFTLDCLRELSSHEPLKETWPSPTIHDLAIALDSLCSRQWNGDLEIIQHDAHAYTRAEVLPERCFESVYMVTLLRDGYGFHPNSQDITFTYLVGGSEVEWSLGMALSLFAQEHHFLAGKELIDVVEHSDSLLSSWNRSVLTGGKNGTEDEGDGASSTLLSQFLSDIIAHLPHWLSAMSYHEIATGKGHFLIL